MEFIDNTGHIFSLPHYNSYPEGYLFDENKYVFWMENEINSSLSVDCFYIKPIRIILNNSSDNIENINIKIESSNNYKLLSPNIIQEKLNSDNFFLNNKDYISLDSINDLTNELNYNNFNESNDLMLLDNLYNEIYYYSDPTTFEQFIYNGEVITEEQSDGNILYYGINYYYVINDIEYNISKDDIIFDDNDNMHIEVNGIKYNCVEKKLLLNKVINNYIMIPFYVVSNVKEEGTWLTNILININNEEYCPITVGGTYKNEQEELIINGQNMGVKFPKDIVRAFYNNSFYNETIDYSLWNQKLKEYLINYMKLHSERGNFRHIINSINWFGYGNKIDIYKLLKIDNEFIEQYVLDNFNINTDIIKTYKLFINSTYISLGLKSVSESTEENKYDFNNEFYGENKPKLIDLFKTVIPVVSDNNEIVFYKQYYDFSFNDLGLKISCMKYYLEKYFLPIHLKIHRASLTHRCFSSDIKLLSTVRNHINANPIHVFDKNILVNFPIIDNTIWISNQIHYVDDNFNEFIEYNVNKDKINNINLYYINDICFTIPIEFSSFNSESFYNVNLMLFRNNEKIIETKFSFYNNIKFYYVENDLDIEYTGSYNDIIINKDLFNNIVKYYFINEFGNKIELKRIILNDKDYNGLVVYPKLLSKEYNMYDWINSDYTLLLLVNNNWYEYNFNIKMPELDINIGKLEYIYNSNLCKQISSIDESNKIVNFNSSMYNPDLVTVNNISFANDLIKYMKTNYLYTINEDISVLRDHIYHYYINYHGYKCIYSIIEKSNNSFNYYVLTNDPNYNDYSDFDINSDNNEFDINNMKFGDQIFNLYELDINKENYNNQLSEFIYKLEHKKIYSSISKNIISFIDLYKENITLSDKSMNIYNKVHLFNLIMLNENGEKSYIKYEADKHSSDSLFELNIEDNITGYKKLIFGNNNNENTVNLYRQFFDVNTGNWINDISYYDENKNKFIEDEKIKLDYDFYLMHDNDYWYAVIISKQPVSTLNKYELNEKIYKIIDNFSFNQKNYQLYLEHVRSDKKFLVNRVKYISADGINKFSNNDIIACKLVSDNLPINMQLNRKWDITPISIGIKNFENIGTNTNMCIISIGDNIKYNPGYYEIKVSYALDNRINYTQSRSTKILIQ